MPDPDTKTILIQLEAEVESLRDASDEVTNINDSLSNINQNTNTWNNRLSVVNTSIQKMKGLVDKVDTGFNAVANTLNKIEALKVLIDELYGRLPDTKENRDNKEYLKAQLDKLRNNPDANIVDDISNNFDDLNRSVEDMPVMEARIAARPPIPTQRITKVAPFMASRRSIVDLTWMCEPVSIMIFLLTLVSKSSAFSSMSCKTSSAPSKVGFKAMSATSFAVHWTLPPPINVILINSS